MLSTRGLLAILAGCLSAALCAGISSSASAASFTGLGDLTGGTFSSAAIGVSADGSVIVGVGTSASGSEAFIWDATNGTRSLMTVLVSDFGLDLTGWTLGQARSVSDDGFTVVGVGTNPSGFTEAFLATIPEPSTALLLGCGLAGIAGMRRRS